MEKKVEREMPKLLLITDGFPYGLGETFLYPEFEVLNKTFAITVVTTGKDTIISESFTWNVPVHRANIQLTRVDLIKGSFVIVRSKIFWKELLNILKTKQQIIKRIAHALKSFLSAIKFADAIESLHIIEHQQLIYTYWHNYKTLGVGMLLNKLKRKDIPIVSRIHRYDLYNDAAGGRQSFKSATDNHLSVLYFISQNGHDYYRETFGFHPNCNYKIAYLGVFGSGHRIPMNRQNDLSIISVSNTIPLKRVHLIVEALALVEGFIIEWIHFGGGEDLESLQTLAKERLGENKNIHYEFKGAVINKEIFDFYLNNETDIFITTSSSEGLPVSIMEAFSFGLPAIGTNVGGIAEIIQHEISGILLTNDPSVDEVKNALLKCIEYKRNGKLAAMRTEAFNIWNDKFNASNNFTDFALGLETLANLNYVED